MKFKYLNHAELIKFAQTSIIYKKNLEYIKLNKIKVNFLSLPKIEKIIIHSTSGQAIKNSKFLDDMYEKVLILSLQKPIKIKSKISESKFKLMKGNLISVKTTLRASKMWIFLEKLVQISIFQKSNFYGFKKKSFHNSNFSFGINDLSVFPEITSNNIKFKFGIDIVIIIKNSDNNKSLKLLKFLGFPFL